MTTTLASTIGWHAWLQRWDVQQTGYLPDREARFHAMFEVLEVVMPAEFVALDLACGPGAISQRLLHRFPQARCIAADLDPFLLTLGQQTLGDMDGRLRWVEADLNTPAWVEALGVTQVDAVLSTTALHWLRNDVLARVYHQLGQLLRPGGVFLNGDHMQFASHLETFNRVATTLKTKRSEVAFVQQGIEDWDQWWAAAHAEPAFAELLAERERRFAHRQRDWVKAGIDFHQSVLREAGFREVDTIWQCLDNRVLMAVR
jgi:trans-aconitate methyltransferase